MTQVLEQHVTNCLTCGKPAAAHVALDQGEPLLVRLVCPHGCPDNDSVRVAIIDLLYGVRVA